MRITIFLLSLFSISIAAAQTISTKTITVEPNLSFQNYEHFKRLVLDSPDSDTEHIAGFEFDWGYRYKLEVKETKLTSSLSDGTQFEYELISILEKTKVPNTTTFKLFIEPNRYYYQLAQNDTSNSTLNQLNDSLYLYFEKVEIVVPTNLQVPFEKTISSGKGRQGTFQYLNNKRIRLIAL